MKRALGAIGHGFAQVLNHIWLMLAINVTTAVLSLPFAVVSVLLAALLHLQPGLALIAVEASVLVLPTPGAAGLHKIMHELACAQPVHVSDWWDGLKEYGPAAMRAWVPGVVALGIIAGNLVYYYDRHSLVSPLMETVWACLLVVWLCVQIYVYPLIAEHGSLRVADVYRDAAALAMSNRLATLFVTAAWTGIVIVCAVSLLTAVLGFALVAGVQHNAVARVLAQGDQTASAGVEAANIPGRAGRGLRER